MCRLLLRMVGPSDLMTMHWFGVPLGPVLVVGPMDDTFGLLEFCCLRYMRKICSMGCTFLYIDVS